MAKIEFDREDDRAFFLDPKDDFAKKEMAYEIRRDGLTGHVSRIVSFRRKIPEMKLDEILIEGSKKDCPFCPEKIPFATPRFVPEIAPEGRLQRGQATLFPNSFPYARYSCVVVLSKGHFLDLDQFSVEMLVDGFSLAQEGIRRVKRWEPPYRYDSINWNYLPESGGGLYHPHLQIVVSRIPTASHRRVLDGIKRFQEGKGASFWEAFLSEEMRRDERYAGRQGNVHFLLAFSPLGILGEILILFSGRLDIRDLSERDWGDFGNGLLAIFGFFRTLHIRSFNLSLFSGHEEGGLSWVYGRLCPRILIPPWNTSDINYFEKLHDEVICVVSPEEMCQGLKPFLAESYR